MLRGALGCYQSPFDRLPSTTFPSLRIYDRAPQRTTNGDNPDYVDSNQTTRDNQQQTNNALNRKRFM